jgi:histidine triad (HIT) family protein
MRLMSVTGSYNSAIAMNQTTSCLFCRIVAGEIPASKVYEDADLMAFSDVNPQAPLHVLVIPKKHIATTNDLSDEDEMLVGRLVRRGAAIAAEKGYAERGYRIVLNCNAEAGQTVFHIHLHVLAGRRLGWPPG